MQIEATELLTTIRVAGDRDALKLLAEKFRVRPPNYWRSPSYEMWKQTLDDPNGPRGWDGYLYPFKVKGNTATLARGHKRSLIDRAAEWDIELTWRRELTSPLRGIEVDDVPEDCIASGFALDRGQRECVAGLLDHAVGTVRMTVSAGKTAMLCTCVELIRRTFAAARTLYIVPTERLVRQVVVEARKFLPDLEISQFGGGKRDMDGKDMVVATMASLYANYEELVHENWFRSFTVLLVDECHRLPSKTWSLVVSSIPAFFRFGASDTLKDEREEDEVDALTIVGHLGPCRAVVSAGELIDVGRIAKPHIHIVDIVEWEKEYEDVPQRPELDTPAWCLIDGVWSKGTYVGPVPLVDKDGEPMLTRKGDPVYVPNQHKLNLVDRGETNVESRWCLLHRAYDVAIIRNKKRNALVVQWAKHFSSLTYPTLVVATRTLHVHILAELLRQAGLEVETLTGEDSSRRRDEAFAWLKPDSGRILVSPLVKEGISLPQLRGGVVADTVCSPDLARQIIGRFVRKKTTGENEAHIAWLLDRQTKSTRTGGLKLFHELERLRGYTFHWPCSEPGIPAARYDAASVD